MYVFADVPHLIKLLRNHYVGQGFIFNEKEINKYVMQKSVFFTNQTDLDIAHKISLKNTPQNCLLIQYPKAISRCGTLGKFDSKHCWSGRFSSALDVDYV